MFTLKGKVIIKFTFFFQSFKDDHGLAQTHLSFSCFAKAANFEKSWKFSKKLKWKEKVFALWREYITVFSAWLKDSVIQTHFPLFWSKCLGPPKKGCLTNFCQVLFFFFFFFFLRKWAMPNAGSFFFFFLIVFLANFFFLATKKKKKSQKLGSAHRAMRQNWVHILMRAGLWDKPFFFLGLTWK